MRLILEDNGKEILNTTHFTIKNKDEVIFYDYEQNKLVSVKFKNGKMAISLKSIQ